MRSIGIAKRSRTESDELQMRKSQVGNPNRYGKLPADPKARARKLKEIQDAERAARHSQILRNLD